MQVDRLGLEDFRNYVHVAVDLAPGLNLVVGRNAQGKTNLLEAIHCLSGLGSPRSPDAALIREGCERSLLHAEVRKGERQLRVDLEIRPGRGTKALINGTPLHGTRPLSEIVVTVFFGPDELSLVKGSPDGRRRFLDDLVVKLHPTRAAQRREWERVLKQRNALLRSAPRRGSVSLGQTLDVWDEALCRTGAGLAAARLQALGRLLPHARKRYEEVAGGGDLELNYTSEWLDEYIIESALGSPAAIDESILKERLAAKLEEVRPREFERGISLVGPQRDDVLIKLISPGATGGQLEARNHASQGEQRTSALALKLAEHDLLTDALGYQPILLLDDVFSELDAVRRGWLGGAVGAMGQTLLSSAEPVSPGSIAVERTLEVSAGQVVAR
ncbi:MAG TPA: DNA replication/repair protein RecF [Actinomycetota bacterium]|nr:DNA replication/repair protein RecF [Actinomycetota bacterium]